MLQVQGTVIPVDAPSMGKRETSLLSCLVKVFLVIALLPIALPVWLATLMFGGSSRSGFASQVAVRVTSYWLSMRLSGQSGDVIVRDFRVRDAFGRQWLVRMHGILTTGNLTVGDSVTIEGSDRNGMLVFRRGENHTIGSALVLK